MNPIQNNGAEAQNVPLYERIDKVDVTKTDTLSQELAGLTEEANAEVSNVFSKDGEGGAKVTGGESCGLNIIKSSFCCLNGKIKASIQSASDEAKQIYQQLALKVSETIDRLTKAMNGVNPDVAAFEPKETDAQEVEPKTEKAQITANTLRIPARKFMALSDNKKEGERILTEYNNCIDSSYNSNRKIASNLKCFQAKYAEMLKTVASSIDDDGKYLLSNLYDQIDSQIRYYSDLADKEAEENQENIINSMTYIPSNPSAGDIASAKKPEGPDPRADWTKIVNPD